MAAGVTSLPALDLEATADHSLLRSSASTRSQSSALTGLSKKDKGTLGGLARRTFGILLLLTTVFLWTASNFLASTIFADDSFSKPFFVTYINSSFFSVFLVGIFLRRLWIHRGNVVAVFKGLERPMQQSWTGEENEAFLKPGDNEAIGLSSSATLSLDDPMVGVGRTLEGDASQVHARLNVRETARLSLHFSMLWFAANYFIGVCLEYTTVASSTILMSTSSIWTLLFGALIKVENFTVKKMLGVLASLAGVILISRVDLSGETDKNRGSFPHKSPVQIGIGDALALGSAVLYGLYAVYMKKKVGDEGRVDMLMFFGFVGAINMLVLWPFFFVLHYTGIEEFEMPPTRQIWTIVLFNSLTSLVSDFTWAFAMLLTSPLLVTVGLSLSIPLSLIGQMILNSQTSGLLYWIGAGIVFLSFIFINHETKEPESVQTGEPGSSGEVANGQITRGVHVD